MTSGEFNTITSILFLTLITLLIRQIILIIKSTILIDKLTESKQFPILLKYLSFIRHEISLISRKHFAEFSSIIAVTDVPKSPLDILIVPTEFVVRIDGNTVSIPTGIDHVYKDVPRNLLADDLFAVQKKSVGNKSFIIKWKNILTNFFYNTNKIGNEYELINEERSVRRENMVIRIARFLSRYEVEMGMVVMANEDEEELVPLVMLAKGQRRDELATVIVVHWIHHVLHTSQVYVRMNAEYPRHVFYQEAVNGIFGFEETPSPECMICCDANVNTGLFPCAHASTCESCTNSFRDSKCPICRTLFNMKIMIPVKDRPTSRDTRPNVRAPSYGSPLD